MINIQEKKTCTGCGVCASACPVSCIQMKPDEEGFLYPQVDKQLCVNCGKCDKVCPVIHAPEVGNSGIAYAAKTVNNDIRRESSSGGVFTEIAQFVLSKGGAVFGAAFDEDFKLKHICVEDAEQLARLRGSKYIQSRIGDCFQKAKALLEAGKPVLFTGTPCQIGGLYSCLGKQYENLYTQDIICHGVPSPAVWERYIKYREAKAGAKVKRVVFRNKESGWRSYSIHLEFENHKTYDQPIAQDFYMQSFLKDLCLRPSCYDCAFKTKHRSADITLADFWGVQNYHPDLDDNQGTSLVVIHSDKGASLFASVKDRLVLEKADLEKAISHNPAMIRPVPLKPEREQFMQDLLREDLRTLQKRYMKEKFSIRIKRKVKSVLKRLLK